MLPVLSLIIAVSAAADTGSIPVPYRCALEHPYFKSVHAYHDTSDMNYDPIMEFTGRDGASFQITRPANLSCEALTSSPDVRLMLGRMSLVHWKNVNEVERLVAKLEARGFIAKTAAAPSVGLVKDEGARRVEIWLSIHDIDAAPTAHISVSRFEAAGYVEQSSWKTPLYFLKAETADFTRFDRGVQPVPDYSGGGDWCN